MNLISSIYHNKLFETIFPTHVYVLKKELKDCQSVLDLGCGPDSPLQYCTNIKHSIGVEAFQPYLDVSQKKNIHTEYINKNIGDLDFEEKSFDAVILMEVIEHMEETEGLDVIKKIEKMYHQNQEIKKELFIIFYKKLYKFYKNLQKQRNIFLINIINN